MPDILSFLKEFLSTEIRFHPVYLLPFFLIALVLYFINDPAERTGFFKWLFPKEIYFHPSHIVDIKLFLLGRIIFLTKILNIVFVQAAFAFVGMGVVAMLTGLEMSTHDLTIGRVLLATFIITLVSDFCVYWVHRLHHESPAIWPFHAVHHSAEVLTPVTVYRKHPVYDFISDFVKAVLTGFIQGVILILLIGKIQLSLIAGINAFYFFFNFLGSNFRHSHIWISYGRVLEHIFISPAQHQIHHSLEPKHHNKNYGEILAIWDWMFGTLYIPEEKEVLQFGIAKSGTSNERIAQPHGTLKDAIIGPVKDSWRYCKKKLAAKKYRS
jgi:sterol desaturase/sphingolipid hydroxylase (fatty acid hydroxylase superfamily)